MKILCGPGTNSTLIRNAMKDASCNAKRQIHVMLYDREGQSRNLVCVFSPFYNHDKQVSGCLVELEHSEVVSIPQALENSPIPKALLSAQPPHAIQLINEAFASRFNLTPELVSGHPIAFVFADLPSTATSALEPILDQARGGRVAHGALHSSSTGLAVTCVPVAGMDDGSVSYLLLLLSAATKPPPPAISTASVTLCAGFVPDTCAGSAVSAFDCPSRRPAVAYDGNGLMEIKPAAAAAAPAGRSHAASAAPCGAPAQALRLRDRGPRLR